MAGIRDLLIARMNGGDDFNRNKMLMLFNISNHKQLDYKTRVRKYDLVRLW